MYTKKGKYIFKRKIKKIYVKAVLSMGFSKFIGNQYFLRKINRDRLLKQWKQKVSFYEIYKNDFSSKKVPFKNGTEWDSSNFIPDSC